VPPFLQTIEDPRAAQGGSLKGCPVCGGVFHFLRFLVGKSQPSDVFFQVSVTSFPTAQSSRILSDGRWLLTGLRKTLAGIKDLYSIYLYVQYLYNVLSYLDAACLGKSLQNHDAQIVIVQ
jgi:hypothetical protein